MTDLQMPQWQTDKRWAGQFVRQMKRICGEYLIDEAPIEEDSQHNTDLIVLRLDSIRIACRVRRYHQMAAYGNQFTIRSARPNGRKTELTKVLEGWGDYLLYGFAGEDEKRLVRWTLGDMAVFRVWFQRESLRLKRMPGEEIPNTDGSSSFRAFAIDSLRPLGFVKAEYRAGGAV